MLESPYALQILLLHIGNFSILIFALIEVDMTNELLWLLYAGNRR